MAISGLIPATQAEFDAFIATYPNPLKRDVIAFAEPNILQFNDFTLGMWPESVVAQYDLYGHDPKDIWAEVPGRWMTLASVE
jgi:hypothetical protein